MPYLLFKITIQSLLHVLEKDLIAERKMNEVGYVPLFQSIRGNMQIMLEYHY
ncbi:hypothetical protein [Bacillus pseudomycoides]|uniref:hypothetical protein n=1 Tax=Bacillus pseudomycoides TaxID=64104 RepID=UPI001483426B|nr:hypothetical protein [Bacillus pseudomycoides]